MHGGVRDLISAVSQDPSDVSAKKVHQQPAGVKLWAMDHKPETTSSHYNCARHFDKGTSNTVALSPGRSHQTMMMFYR